MRVLHIGQLLLVLPVHSLTIPGHVFTRQYTKPHSVGIYSVAEDSKIIDAPLSPSKIDLSNRYTLLQSGLRNNYTAPSTLLDEINNLRKSNNQAELDSYLDGLISMIDYSLDTEKSLPFWTRFKVFTRFSKRARLASLNRVLDMSTPVEDSESKDDDTDAKKRRRKRAFLLLLRSLAEEGEEKTFRITSTPTILKLEKLAKSSSKNSDIETRVPQGLETPKYEVLKHLKNCEIRRYSNYSVCTVDMTRPANSTTDAKISNPQLPGASSFGALAGYIFGKNDRSEAMKMTTPVFTTLDNSRKMSFVMPSTYWGKDLTNAPKPLMDSGVTLSTRDSGTRAVLMFGGFASKKVVQLRELELLDVLKGDEEWVIDDDVVLAQYNDPFTPPWKRRNEVSVSVVSREDL